ncbi:MAG: RNA polymerase-associated protein RapA [Methylophaga sp.]
MSEIEFIIGQRWVSNGEAELGLGIIKESTGRRIEVFFPAVAESRFYAADNAPLSRVIYSVGEQVKTQEQQSFHITAVQTVNGCLIYQGETTDGESVSFHEMDLDSRVHFNQPQDRLFAGQVDKNSQFELRAKALACQHELFSSPVFGLMGARVQLIPHQLYIARQVSQRHAPRVLLADEVGLGKTIEAGLILHQKILSGEVKRSLIIVPDALLHQWLVEMLRRFNLSFSLIDAERHQALNELNEGNPFDSAQLVLCGLNTLLDNPAMQDDVQAAAWDMLIVDEAHHLYWEPDHVSPGYQLIESLAAHIPALLLLTATPEQLGEDSHFASLRLLDPERFHDLEAFRRQQASYQPISTLIEQLDQLACEDSQILASLMPALQPYLPEDVLTELQQAATFEPAKQRAIRHLLDHHGTGRVLFRNTREVVKGFPARVLHDYPLEADSRLAGADSLLPEQIWGDEWLTADKRLDWLLDFLKARRGEKVLLICASAKTATELDTHLRVQHGIRCAAFHEKLSLINRDRAAAYFAEEEEGAQLLICSEIGSEGRNFQFCHHLVLLDLPQHPDLLEQRIGRLDRIGQQHDVQIHVPYYQGSAQEVLLHWYHQGMNAFEAVFAAGDTIMGQTATLLEKCLNSPEDKAALSQLIDITRDCAEQARQALQSGRNRLLERNSFDAVAAQHIIEELDASTRALELADFMDDVFDAFGVDQQPHSSDSVIIQPGNHMSHPFPELPEDGITATYQRHRALGREDMAFLTWEHPMVLGAMDLVINTEIGNSAFCTLETDLFSPGTLLLEALFKVHAIGALRTTVDRFLPQRYLRVVVDAQGREHQTGLTEKQFNKLAGRIPRATAQELIRHARSRLEVLIQKAQQAAIEPGETLRETAMRLMQQEMSEEMARLQALAAVNPAIRQVEIDALAQLTTDLANTIQSAELSLDAVRVAIVTEAN